MLCSDIEQDMRVGVRSMSKLIDKIMDKFICLMVGHKWEYSEDGTQGKCLHCGKEVVWPRGG